MKAIVLFQKVPYNPLERGQTESDRVRSLSTLSVCPPPSGHTPLFFKEVGMRLTRVIVRANEGLHRVQGDFRSNAGSRVRVNLGRLDEERTMLDILSRVEAAADDYRKLREIGRM